MAFLRNKVLSRVPGATLVGRLADLAIVSNAGLRFAHRKGFVSDEMATKFGAANSAAGKGLSMNELMLVGMAAFRLLGKARKKK